LGDIEGLARLDAASILDEWCEAAVEARNHACHTFGRKALACEDAQQRLGQAGCSSTTDGGFATPGAQGRQIGEAAAPSLPGPSASEFHCAVLQQLQDSLGSTCFKNHKKKTKTQAKKANTKVLAVLGGPKDFKFCASHGGSAQCAACREKDGSGGALACDAARPAGKRKRNLYSSCPDSLHTGKVFFTNGGGTGWCTSFWGINVIKGTTLSTTQFPFGDREWGQPAAGKAKIKSVLTKAGVGHSHKAPLASGYFWVKRLVEHTTDDGRKVADVMKKGYVVCCPLLPIKYFERHVNRKFFGNSKAAIKKGYGAERAIKLGYLSEDKKLRTVFHQIWAAGATLREKWVFVKHCVEKAFDHNTQQLKAAYKCPTKLPKIPRPRLTSPDWRPWMIAQDAFSLTLKAA